MADALASAAAGHNLSRASFLEFTIKHSEIERELQDCAETKRSLNKRRKDLRKNMGAAGIDLDMFDRVLDDLELTGDELRVRDFEYRRYMEWREKPVGFQPSMDLATDDPGERAFNTHELHAIDGEGFDAGKTGRRRDSNPYRPGSEPFQRWSNAWNRGQKAAVEEMGSSPADGAANGHDTGAEPKRRGRPRGSRNQPKAAGGNGGEPQPEPPPEPGPTEPEQQPPPPAENPSPEPEPPAAA